MGDNTADGVFSPTQLGTAALVSALGAEDSLAVFADLSQAQRALSLDNELHMLYLVSVQRPVAQASGSFFQVPNTFAY